MSATPAPEDGFRGLLPCFEGKPSRQRRCVKSSCVDIEVEARELALRQVLAACDKCGFPKIGDPYYKDPQMKVPLIFGRSPSSPPCGLAVKTPLQGHGFAAWKVSLPHRPKYLLVLHPSS